MDNIIKDILNEVARQDVKWGKNRILKKDLWLVVMGEEYGEVAEAILNNDNDNYREELIQLAALCLQSVQSFDGSRETIDDVNKNYGVKKKRLFSLISKKCGDIVRAMLEKDDNAYAEAVS